MTYGRPGSVHVSVEPDRATGEVTVWEGSHEVAAGSLSGGQADVAIPGTSLTPGRHGLTVSYSGDSSVAGSSTAVDLQVAKATPKLTATHKPSTVHAQRASPKVIVALTSPGHRVAGQVTVTTGGRTYVARLANGTVTVTLKPYSHTGKQKVNVAYLGNQLDKAVRTTFTIRVVK
jgi:hypothetical protein